MSFPGYDVIEVRPTDRPATASGKAEPPVQLRRISLASGSPRRMLLLHGLANSAAVWEPTESAWPADVEVWSADLPWRSDGPRSWHHQPNTVRRMAEILHAVPGGADLVVAHSFSANLLLDLLSTDLADGVDLGAHYGISGLVFVSPFYRQQPTDFGWDAIPTLLAKFQETILEGIRAHSRRPMSEQLQHDIVAKVCERIGPYGWLRFFELYLRTPWLRTDLIDLPCAVIAGSADTTALPAEAVALAADLPNATARVFDDCGHFPMIERPQAFAAVVRDLLDTLPVRDQPGGLRQLIH